MEFLILPLACTHDVLARREGTISLGEKAERLSAGQMRSVPAGQALSFDNPGAYPLVLRFYVFEGKLPGRS
jgi:hypothetical protein